ncbi:MAG: hypothetical protein AABZ30_02330 [Myxococcota bacterium]
MGADGLTRREFLEAARALGFGALVASATRAWGLDATRFASSALALALPEQVAQARRLQRRVLGGFS